MAQKIIIEPVAGNAVILTLSDGTTIQVTDTYPQGGEIQVSHSRGAFENARRKRIQIVPANEKNGTDFHVEMEPGWGKK